MQTIKTGQTEDASDKILHTLAYVGESESTPKKRTRRRRSVRVEVRQNKMKTLLGCLDVVVVGCDVHFTLNQPSCLHVGVSCFSVSPLLSSQ